jgi:hypothetical protein
MLPLTHYLWAIAGSGKPRYLRLATQLRGTLGIVPTTAKAFTWSTSSIHPKEVSSTIRAKPSGSPAQLHLKRWKESRSPLPKAKLTRGRCPRDWPARQSPPNNPSKGRRCPGPSRYAETQGEWMMQSPKHSDAPNELLTTAEVAQLLNIGVESARLLMKRTKGTVTLPSLSGAGRRQVRRMPRAVLNALLTQWSTPGKRAR